MSGKISRRDIIKAAAATSVWASLSSASAQVTPAGQPEQSSKLPYTVFKDGSFVLPELPYAYDALEPHYERRTLRIHHQKHHAGYVRGLNNALASLKAARDSGDYSAIKSLSRALAFHGSGNVLHCLFWESMAPGGSEMPDDLAEAMKISFGSVDAGRGQFIAATKAVEGSGWGILAYEPSADKLIVLQAEKHQNLTFWSVAPILVCDVWEHAYYLQFQNNRADWVSSFMKIANWQAAARRLKALRS